MSTQLTTAMFYASLRSDARAAKYTVPPEDLCIPAIKKLELSFSLTFLSTISYKTLFKLIEFEIKGVDTFNIMSQLIGSPAVADTLGRLQSDEVTLTKKWH